MYILIDAERASNFNQDTFAHGHVQVHWEVCCLCFSEYQPKLSKKTQFFF